MSRGTMAGCGKFTSNCIGSFLSAQKERTISQNAACIAVYSNLFSSSVSKTTQFLSMYSITWEQQVKQSVRERERARELTWENVVQAAGWIAVWLTGTDHSGDFRNPTMLCAHSGVSALAVLIDVIRALIELAVRAEGSPAATASGSYTWPLPRRRGADRM